ncbi:MAG: MBL fold metallo-hydrolase [Chloroflexi bacterium]|nr:MBL fold metallo-hydrolase [Chloroflexota bacterium]
MNTASEHFSLTELAEGVFAAIATEAGGAFSNAGIIDLGDQTLVFDTMNTPLAAKDLKQVAEELTGRHISYIVNSHWHSDHWMGNQVFPKSTMIFSTPETLEFMISELDEIHQSQSNHSNFRSLIETYEKLYNETKDESHKKNISDMISRWKFELDALPELNPRLPNMTFDSKITFHGKNRVAELFASGKGHTISDVFLALPEDQIVFWGDLGFFQCQPFIGSCDLEGWKLKILSMTNSLFKHFVPGHGPLGNQSDLHLEHQYMVTLEEKVREAFQGGMTVEDALSKISLPEPFNQWVAASARRFEANVRFLFQYFDDRM